MYTHIFKYSLKEIIRDKMIIFWTLVFPLALSFFFNLAFSNLYDASMFETIDVAIVQDSNYKEQTSFDTLIKALSSSDDKLVKIKYVDNEKEARKLLEEDTVKGYYKAKDGKIVTTVKSNGVDETILASIVDDYYQTYSTMSNIGSINPELVNEQLIMDIHKKYDNYQDNSNEKNDTTVIYFYSLIGMTCLYGGFFGIRAVNRTEANLSTKGARMSIAPVHKFKTFLANLSAGYLVQYIEVLVLCGFMKYALGIDFNDKEPYILLLALVGCLVGVGTGALVSSLSTKPEEKKIDLFVTSTLFLSFLSGMMVVQMKYLVLEYAPIVAMINPVNLITDGLYSLYYYNTYDQFFLNVAILGFMSILLIAGCYLKLRRKRYDSI